jgi:hypothetical protein
VASCRCDPSGILLRSKPHSAAIQAAFRCDPRNILPRSEQHSAAIQAAFCCDPSGIIRSAKTSDRGIAFFKAGKSTKSKTKRASFSARSMIESKAANRSSHQSGAIRSFFRSTTFLWIRS